MDNEEHSRPESCQDMLTDLSVEQVVLDHAWERVDLPAGELLQGWVISDQSDRTSNRQRASFFLSSSPLYYQKPRGSLGAAGLCDDVDGGKLRVEERLASHSQVHANILCATGTVRSSAAARENLHRLTAPASSSLKEKNVCVPMLVLPPVVTLRALLDNVTWPDTAGFRLGIRRSVDWTLALINALVVLKEASGAAAMPVLSTSSVLITPSEEVKLFLGGPEGLYPWQADGRHARGSRTPSSSFATESRGIPDACPVDFDLFEFGDNSGFLERQQVLSVAMLMIEAAKGGSAVQFHETYDRQREVCSSTSTDYQRRPRRPRGKEVGASSSGSASPDSAKRNTALQSTNNPKTRSKGEQTLQELEPADLLFSLADDCFTNDSFTLGTLQELLEQLRQCQPYLDDDTMLPDGWWLMASKGQDLATDDFEEILSYEQCLGEEPALAVGKSVSLTPTDSYKCKADQTSVESLRTSTATGTAPFKCSSVNKDSQKGVESETSRSPSSSSKETSPSGQGRLPTPKKKQVIFQGTLTPVSWPSGRNNERQLGPGVGNSVLPNRELFFDNLRLNWRGMARRFNEMTSRWKEQAVAIAMQAEMSKVEGVMAGTGLSKGTDVANSASMPLTNSYWLQQPPLPVEKWGGRVVTCQHWLVVVGGGVGELACSHVFAFNALRQQWCQWTDAPHPESAPASDNSSIYIAGGRPATKEVYSVKPPLPGETTIWKLVARMPCAIQNGVATFHLGQLFILSRTNFLCYNPATEQWHTIFLPRPNPESCGTKLTSFILTPPLSEFTELPSCLVAVGSRLITDAGWFFDVEEWKWFKHPIVNYGCSMVNYNGWLLVVGGLDATQQSTSQVLALEGGGHHWQRLPMLSVPRSFSSVAILCGTVYVIGGYWQDSAGGRTGLSSVECIW